MANKYWVNGTGELNSTGFESNHPPAYSTTYVLATASTASAHLSMDPAISLIGARAGWMGTGTADLRYHIDLGSEKIITRVYYENEHASGLATNLGVRAFTLWGSNGYSPSSVTFTDAGDWVNLASHGLVTGQAVTFTAITGGTVTTITPGTVYYVRTAGDADKFNLATTPTGATMTFTTTGTPASNMQVDVFKSLTYAIDTGWFPLDVGDVVEFDQHVGANQADPKYIAVANTTTYRYYAFKFHSNWGGATYMELRRVELYTEHITTSTGGTADKANAMTTSDNLTFDGNSGGAYTVTMSSPPIIHDMTISSGTVTFSGNLSTSGSLVLSGTPTLAGTWTLTFTATAGTETITTNSNIFVGNITFNGSGGTFQLADNLTTTGNMTLTAGTFDANAKTVTMTGTGQTITGSFTFYNLIRTGTATTTDYVYFHNSITVSNNLTLTGNSTTNILTASTPTLSHGAVTLTVNGTLNATNTRFLNIYGGNASTPYICGSGCIDLAGNQNLDFGLYSGQIKG